MIKEFFVASMLTVLAFKPVMADNLDQDAEMVQPTFTTVAYDVYEGSSEVVYGTVKLAKGVGSLGYDVLKVGEASLQTIEGVLHFLNAGTSYALGLTEDAPKDGHLSKAVTCLKTAGKELKEGIYNVPTTATYFKEGLQEDAKGVKKIVQSLYNGAKELSRCEKVQSAVTNIKSGLSTLGSWFSSKVSKLNPFMDFSDLNFA